MALSRQHRADATLVLVTLIWGTTFVLVYDAMESYPVFSFLAIRFGLAVIALLPLVWWQAQRQGTTQPLWKFRKPELAAGIILGLVLFVSFALQTAGLQFTTPAKAGFITGLSVVMVPIGATVFLRKPPHRNAIIGVALATVGLALLSLDSNLEIALGDVLVFLCAIGFAGQVILTAHFAPKHSAVRLVIIQIATVALASLLAAFIFETNAYNLPRPAGNVIFAAVFTGVLATSGALTMQTHAQRYTSPTHAALIFTLEPVFAAIFSYLLIGELLGAREIWGGVLILTGMLAAELYHPTVTQTPSLRSLTKRSQKKKGWVGK